MRTKLKCTSMLACLAAFAATSAYAGYTNVDLAGFTELDEVTDFTYTGGASGWQWSYELAKATAEEGGTKNIYGTNTITTNDPVSHGSKNALGLRLLKNSTVNLGSADGSKTGSLSFVKTAQWGANGAFHADEGSTFNINKGSSFNFFTDWKWGNEWPCTNELNGTINVYGKFSLNNASGGYKVYTNLNATGTINLYADSYVGLNNLVHKGTINIYGTPSKFLIETYGASGIKAWDVTGDTAKLGIYTNGAFEKALENSKFGKIDLNGTLTVEIGDAAHAVSSALLPLLNFGAGGTVNIDFAEAAILGLKGLDASDKGEGFLNFNNFYNDMVYAEGEITIENGAIQLASGMEIVLEAYDLAGNFIDGEWSVKKVGEKYFINNSAASPCPIPEPATCAAIFGALALLSVFLRKRR